jgi:hypothetical protein
VALEHRPEAVRLRIVGRALEEHRGAAGEQGAADQHGPHEPAEIGDPEEPVALAQVEQIGEVVRILDRKAAVGEHGALGPAGGARRVDDQARMIGLDGQRRALRRLLRHQLVPPEIAVVLPRHVALAPAVHDHVLHAGRGAHRVVRSALERHRLAAPGEGVRGDEQARIAAVETRGHRLRAVAREARRVHRADPGHRERGDHRLRAHGQEDPDRVAGADPEPLEGVGEPIHLGAQLRIGQRAGRTVFRFRDHRGLAAAARRDVPVHAVVREIETAARKPVGPGDALG